jgi:hypothetical protein
MARGGKRLGAGRPKGRRNKVPQTVARRERCYREAEASGLMPLQWMLKVMRDPQASPARRDWAAQAAAPYLYSRMPTYNVVNTPTTFDPETGSPIIEINPSPATITINLIPVAPGEYLDPHQDDDAQPTSRALVPAGED